MAATKTVSRFNIKKQVSKLKNFNWNTQHKQTNNLIHPTSQVASHNTWGHNFSLTRVKLFPLSASMSHTTGRDQKCIFESGCYGSGNVAVNVSGCSNTNGRTAERSFGSMSQPAGFLQLLRIAEIHLLSLCRGTDSTKAPRSLLLVRFCFFWSVCLLLSALPARNFTQRSLLWQPGLAHPLAPFLVFPAIPPTSPLVMSLFPSLATFLYTLEFWGCKFKLAKVNKSCFSPASSPFSLYWTTENNTLFSVTIPSSRYVLQDFSTIHHAHVNKENKTDITPKQNFPSIWAFTAQYIFSCFQRYIPFPTNR